MGKGGGDVLKEAERGVRDTARKWKNDPWGQFKTTAVDLLSGTSVKLKDNGSLDYGSSFHRFDEIIGAISGRNAARAANYETQDKIRAAGLASDKQIADERLAAYRADIGASRNAAAIRSTTDTRANATSGTGTNYNPNIKLGAEEQDLLGL